MEETEAIKELIAFAVCGDSKLHCDVDCPYYLADKECKRIEEDFKTYEAVKTLNKKEE